MKRLTGVLLVVFVAVGAYAGARIYSNLREYNMSVNPVYGEALRACEDDDVICSFSSAESAQAYLNSPKHLSAIKMRQLKADQDRLAAENAQQSGKVKTRNLKR